MRSETENNLSMIDVICETVFHLWNLELGKEKKLAAKSVQRKRFCDSYVKATKLNRFGNKSYFLSA